MFVCGSNSAFAQAPAGLGASFLFRKVAGLLSFAMHSNEVRANESC
jgi:hypothetical protein